LLLGLIGLTTAVWLGVRLYLQITGIRHSPQIYSALVLPEMKRLKPFTRFLYTDDPVYSFHAGIPLPPELGVIGLKRFWSGDLTDARLAAELAAANPGMVLLQNSTRELPFGDWLNAEYRLIYEDQGLRLYASKAVLAQAKQARRNP